MDRKWWYTIIIGAVLGTIAFISYSSKDFIIYAGQRDRELTRTIERTDTLEKRFDKIQEKQDEIINKQNEIDKKVVSIYTIVKALAEKEDLNYE